MTLTKGLYLLSKEPNARGRARVYSTLGFVCERLPSPAAGLTTRPAH